MRRPSRAGPAALVALATLSCGFGITEPEPLLTGLPRELSPAESRLIDAGNQLTFDLFRTATRNLAPTENAFLSPLSASMALGMALNGARGETATALQATLGFGTAPLTEINQGYKDLTTLLTGLDRTTEIVVANSVWSDIGFPILPTFVEAARAWFDAEARSLDFRNPATVETINSWVRNRTRDRIPTLLDQIRSDEVAFLINALYFKGKWRAGFDRSRTGPRPFHAADGTVREVPTMVLDPTRLQVAGGVDWVALDLLYGNGAFAMTILLPTPGRTPTGILATLDAAAWRRITAEFAERQVGVTLPRFRLEYTRDLKPDLTDLGMGIAFDPLRADFSGIADVAPDRLFVTRVLQKTFVEVNEEGTEAAAATSVGTGVTSLPPVVNVDRPFLFAIRERFSGTVLFLGLVNTIP